MPMNDKINFAISLLSWAGRQDEGANVNARMLLAVASQEGPPESVDTLANLAGCSYHEATHSLLQLRRSNHLLGNLSLSTVGIGQVRKILNPQK